MGPEREFCPCSPLPEVDPCPEASPRPSRVLFFLAPWLSLEVREKAECGVRNGVQSNYAKGTSNVRKCYRRYQSHLFD